MKNGRSGYTLVEVVISMLLTAILCSAVFSIAITAQQSGNKVDRRVVANQYSRHLTETLANYVSADASAGNSLIAGPTSATPGAASWSITGALGADGVSITDACPGGGSACWALAAGTHTLTDFLPRWFTAAPYSATVTYYVPATGSGSYSLGNGNVNNVNVTINWTEP